MTLLGGTSFLGIAGAIAYRKENKKLKQNEVKASNVETQKQEIELAEMYKDKVVELIEQLGHKQESGNQNQERILSKLDKLDERMDNTESTLGNIVTYLNGDFQDYLQRQRPAPKPPRRRTPKPKTAVPHEIRQDN